MTFRHFGQVTWKALKLSTTKNPNVNYVFPTYNSKLQDICSTSYLVYPPFKLIIYTKIFSNLSVTKKDTQKGKYFPLTTNFSLPTASSINFLDLLKECAQDLKLNIYHVTFQISFKGRSRRLRPKAHILDDPLDNPYDGLMSSQGHPMGPTKVPHGPIIRPKKYPSSSL